MFYLVHFVRDILHPDVGVGEGDLQGLGLVHLVAGLLLHLPPLLVHALLPPKELPHVGPACGSALLEAGGPEVDNMIANYFDYSAFLTTDFYVFWYVLFQIQGA